MNIFLDLRFGQWVVVWEYDGAWQVDRSVQICFNILQCGNRGSGLPANFPQRTIVQHGTWKILRTLKSKTDLPGYYEGIFVKAGR